MITDRKTALFCAAAMFAVAIPAQASENIGYTYDALGRLVSTTSSGGPASGVTTATTYDPAGNRTNQTTTGASNPGSGGTCTFAAVNVEGTDEFSVYPYILKTGTCSGAVTVSANVQQVSGQGTYGVYSAPGKDLIFQPTETEEYIRIIPWYNTVSPGNPLVLQVTWMITSGSGMITDNTGTVTLYNSDCYC